MSKMRSNFFSKQAVRASDEPCQQVCVCVCVCDDDDNIALPPMLEIRGLACMHACMHTAANAAGRQGQRPDPRQVNSYASYRLPN